MNIPAFTDQKTGKPSYTLTMLAIGFAVVNLKLLFSGIQLTQTLKLSEFSGTDYGAAIAALGGVYSFRKNSTIKPDTEVQK